MTEAKPEGGAIRVGIGGWTFEPWRTTFYPAGLVHAKELHYASRQVTSIEVNATYYRTQSPQSFRRWADTSPEGFIFSVKASRYATNRKDLAEADSAIDHFVQSGITELGPKLGPILWQLAPTKQFKADEIARFASRLPREHDGLALRHVLEVRHRSFQCADFVAVARDHGVAICLAVSDTYPLIADLTADFAYLRLQTTTAEEPDGYDAAAIQTYAAYAKALSEGHVPADLPLLAPAAPTGKRDCFVFVISGAKERNPAAARALLQSLK